MDGRWDFICRSLPWFAQQGCSSSCTVGCRRHCSTQCLPAPGPAQPSVSQPSWGAELLCSILPADGDWKLHFEGTATPSAAACFQKAITHPLQARLCLLLRPAFLEEGRAVFKEQQSFPLSWLPRSSAEKQKEPEGPAIDIIYQCRPL